MIQKKADMRTELRERMRDGEGTVTITHLVEQENLRNCRLMATIELPVGAGIGEHTHTDETEYYIIHTGEGLVGEKDGEKKVYAGDVVITRDGEAHSIRNTGSIPLVITAVIIND